MASRIEFGVDAVEYTTQTKSDYRWPAAKGRQESAEVAKVQGRSSLVTGYDKVEYTTETGSRYTSPVVREEHKTVAHKPESRKLHDEEGGDARTFSTTHRDGFPTRALDVASLRQNKDATLEVNRAHFSLGSDAATFETTYRAAIASVAAAKDLPPARVAGTSSGSALALAAAGATTLPSGEPIPTAASLFGHDAPSYTTTNAMPLYDIKYARAKPVDPTSWSGMSGTPGAAAVVAKLTTSGKPLSAVAFGYDMPEYKTETLERTGEADIALRKPYTPKLTPKYIKDHPALRGAATGGAGGKAATASPLKR